MSAMGFTLQNVSVVLTLALAVGCKASPTAGQAGAGNDVEKTPAAALPDRALAAGDVVNDFQAIAHTGERVRLSRYLDKPALLYFCAQDTAVTCAALAGGIRDHWLELNAHVSMVFGVSREDRQLHNAFATDQRLPFLLLADSEQNLEKTFGVAAGAHVAYLIGSDRKVLRVFNAPLGGNIVAEVLGALSQLGLRGPDYPI
jgi:peroxiredoxin